MDELAGRVTAPFEEVDAPPVVRLPSARSQGISWADLNEQYDVLFNSQKPDIEAQLMGIPPPPADWITPRHPLRTRPLHVEEEVATRNRFTALQPAAHGSCWPASAHQSAPPTSPSTFREEEPHPPTPSPRRNSTPPASVV